MPMVKRLFLDGARRTAKHGEIIVGLRLRQEASLYIYLLRLLVEHHLVSIRLCI
jgi:hypothetical protein